MPSTITLALKVALDDPTKDAIAFESGEMKQVFDKTQGKTVEIPKWNWVARQHISAMEDAEDGLIDVTIPEWVARKKGMLS